MRLQGPFQDQVRLTEIDDPLASAAYLPRRRAYSLAGRRPGTWLLIGVGLVVGVTFLLNGWWGIGIPLVVAAVLRWQDRSVPLLQSRMGPLLFGVLLGLFPTMLLLGLSDRRLSEAWPMPLIESFWRQGFCREHMLDAVVGDDELLGIPRHALVQRLGTPDIEAESWARPVDRWVVVDSLHDDLHLVAYYDKKNHLLRLERRIVRPRWTR